MTHESIPGIGSILQVNSADIGGGAERISWNLHCAYRRLGYRSRLAVGCRRSEDPDVCVIGGPAAPNLWTKGWLAIDRHLSPLVGKIRGAGRVQRMVRLLAVPKRLGRVLQGHEDFYSPGTWRLLEVGGDHPEILHCHNLHGNYFDLEALPWLSQQLPVVVTLHDAWLLSGHCAHSFECERWRTGCGNCPDIKIYPPIVRDATAYNWERKAQIYKRSRLYIATPSHWLMRSVEQSMLSKAIVEKRVIPNGIDLSIFRPEFRPDDRKAARAAVEIPEGVRMVLFMGGSRMRRPWKDRETIDAAIRLVAKRAHDQQVWFVGIGETAPSVSIGNVTIVFRRYLDTLELLARYYQAADIYVHAAHVDTFPNMVIEALACGTPVVATDVGGIQEQIKPLIPGQEMVSEQRSSAAHVDATGILVPPRDPLKLANAILFLLENDAVRMRLGENAAADAKCRFDEKRMVESYLDWYKNICAARSGHA